MAQEGLSDRSEGVFEGTGSSVKHSKRLHARHATAESGLGERLVESAETLKYLRQSEQLVRSQLDDAKLELATIRERHIREYHDLNKAVLQGEEDVRRLIKEKENLETNFRDCRISLGKEKAMNRKLESQEERLNDKISRLSATNEALESSIADANESLQQERIKIRELQTSHDTPATVGETIDIESTRLRAQLQQAQFDNQTLSEELFRRSSQDAARREILSSACRLAAETTSANQVWHAHLMQLSRHDTETVSGYERLKSTSTSSPSASPCGVPIVPQRTNLSMTASQSSVEGRRRRRASEPIVSRFAKQRGGEFAPPLIFPFVLTSRRSSVATHAFPRADSEISSASDVEVGATLPKSDSSTVEPRCHSSASSEDLSLAAELSCWHSANNAGVFENEEKKLMRGPKHSAVDIVPVVEALPMPQTTRDNIATTAATSSEVRDFAASPSATGSCTFGLSMESAREPNVQEVPLMQPEYHSPPIHEIHLSPNSRFSSPKTRSDSPKGLLSSPRDRFFDPTGSLYSSPASLTGSPMPSPKGRFILGGSVFGSPKRLFSPPRSRKAQSQQSLLLTSPPFWRDQPVSAPPTEFEFKYPGQNDPPHSPCPLSTKRKRRASSPTQMGERHKRHVAVPSTPPPSAAEVKDFSQQQAWVKVFEKPLGKLYKAYAEQLGIARDAPVCTPDETRMRFKSFPSSVAQPAPAAISVPYWGSDRPAAVSQMALSRRTDDGSVTAHHGTFCRGTQTSDEEVQLRTRSSRGTQTSVAIPQSVYVDNCTQTQEDLGSSGGIPGSALTMRSTGRAAGSRPVKNDTVATGTQTAQDESIISPLRANAMQSKNFGRGFYRRPSRIHRWNAVEKDNISPPRTISTFSSQRSLDFKFPSFSGNSATCRTKIENLVLSWDATNQASTKPDIAPQSPAVVSRPRANTNKTLPALPLVPVIESETADTEVSVEPALMRAPIYALPSIERQRLPRPLKLLSSHRPMVARRTVVSSKNTTEQVPRSVVQSDRPPLSPGNLAGGLRWFVSEFSASRDGKEWKMTFPPSTPKTPLVMQRPVQQSEGEDSLHDGHIITKVEAEPEVNKEAPPVVETVEATKHVRRKSSPRLEALASLEAKIDFVSDALTGKLHRLEDNEKTALARFGAEWVEAYLRGENDATSEILTEQTAVANEQDLLSVGAVLLTMVFGFKTFGPWFKWVHAMIYISSWLISIYLLLETWEHRQLWFDANDSRYRAQVIYQHHHTLLGFPWFERSIMWLVDYFDLTQEVYGMY